MIPRLWLIQDCRLEVEKVREKRDGERETFQWGVPQLWEPVALPGSAQALSTIIRELGDALPDTWSPNSTLQHPCFS